MFPHYYMHSDAHAKLSNTHQCANRRSIDLTHFRVEVFQLSHQSLKRAFVHWKEKDDMFSFLHNDAVYIVKNIYFLMNICMCVIITYLTL